MALAAEIDVPYHISGDPRCSPAVHTREMSMHTHDLLGSDNRATVPAEPANDKL